MSEVVHLQLLGDFRLTRDGALVEGVDAPRLQSLVAYLALRRDTPQRRQRLAFLFWPNSSEAQARNNLRQLLHATRHTAPDLCALLAIDGQSIGWRSEVDLRLDVDELSRACDAVEERTSASVEHMRVVGRRLLELYQGDLLPACYDEWATPERDRLRERFTQALGWLVAYFEAEGDTELAIRCARQLIRHDPLREEAYRALMRLLALGGDRMGELRAFQACASALRQALGASPGQATVDLHHRLLRLPPTLANGSARSPAEGAQAGHQPLALPPSLVGREREWAALHEAWRAADAGGPGFALITGEAGIGKSRLAEEMTRWVSAQGGVTATARSYAAEGQLSFAPVIEWLRTPGLRPHLRRLKPVWLGEIARLLPELLAERPDLPRYEPLTEYGQRQRFFQALALAALAAPQPLLLVMDDLQWCDQETLEWLHFLLRYDPRARVLLLGAARVEESPPEHSLHALLQHARRAVAVTELTLRPLDAAESARLAARMIERELDDLTALRLFGETEGNPLFIIETVRAGLDSLPARPTATDLDALLQPSGAAALPPGVRAAISSRLARLSPPAREMAGLAAVIGREFSVDILAHVSQASEDHIVNALDELWLRRIVRERGAVNYDFTHDKLREVAYAEISAPQRRLWRRRVAQALEMLRADDLDAISGQIAAHYEQGGAIDRAIPYYHRAALVAQRVFAYDDAVRLLRHGLALLERTPGGAERDTCELRLLLALAPLYRITLGWTAPELERVVDRIMALCDTVGDDQQRAEALYGLQSLLVVQARLERVLLVAEELHTLYDRIQGITPPLADMMLAGARLHLGHYGEASSAFERTLFSAGDAGQARHVQETQGWNAIVHARAWRAHALWGLGYAEQAIGSAREAIAMAEQLQEPFNQALAATYGATLSQFSADPATARADAENALALATEFRAPYYQSWAAILTRYAEARDQPDDTRIAALAGAISAFETSGAKLRLSYYLALLASVYGQARRLDEGMDAIEAALVHARQTNERWWDAELHRLRAELKFAAGHDRRDVEAALTRAADIARTQGARALELRAHLTRYRLLGSQADDDVRLALSAAYAQLTEGFDTPDAQSARLLLTPL
ncbi:MAG: AAA family ATPase [Chloroflexota bacterium]|nr:AAA family ATPase [Chloroflexota bacterium]